MDSDEARSRSVRALVAELTGQPRPHAGLARQLWWLLARQEIAIVHRLEAHGLLVLSQRDRAALDRRIMRGKLAETETLATTRLTQEQC